MSIRTQRVGDLIRQLVSELVLEKLHDPRVRGVHITDVKVSPDLRHADLYFSLVPGGAEQRQAAAEALARASGFLRREVGRRIRLRVTPQLRFLPDDSLEYAAHIEEVLNQIRPPASAEEAPHDDSGDGSRDGQDEVEPE